MFKLISLVSLAVVLASCSKGGGSAAAPKSPLSLYSEDVSSLSSQQYSKSIAANQPFTQVFGGASGASVKSYLDERVKNVLMEDQLNSVGMTPNDFVYKQWLNMDTAQNNAQSATLVAMNIGIAVALLAKVNSAPTTLYLPGQPGMPVNSTRVGLVTLSKNYAPQFTDAANNTLRLPYHGRMSILVHEARHSDCTGGFPASYVSAAQSATNYVDFLQRIQKPQLQCGHLHTFCPPSSSAAQFNLPICDQGVWNSYGVGGIYLATVLANSSDLNLDDRHALENLLIDTATRLPLGFRQLWETTSPDMSHVDF